MQSGKVIASIETIVNDLKPITWKQVLYEAITNAIQADATEIKINFIQDAQNYIDSIVVEDNGDGFNETNTKSFREYRSNYKKHLGCKGIGRFLFLKLFERVEIRSLDKSIEFVIDRDIEVSSGLEACSKTEVRFFKPKERFSVNYKIFKDELKSYFLAYFKLLKDENRLIKISICEDNRVYSIVESDDIPDFKEKIFMIGTHRFKLSYIFDFNSDGYYCAGNRVVIKNSELESNKKFRFFKDVNILYLLSSPYLDISANDTRDDFNIYPKKKRQDLLHSLSWQEIQQGIKEQVKIIARENNIEIDKLSEASLQQAIKEAPFLVYYLQDNELGEDSQELQRRAKKLFEKDKQFLRDSKNETHDKYKEKLAIVTQSELTEYIYGRQKKINLFEKLTDEKITPSRAEEQLIDYAGYINEAYQDRKIRIWSYAFLKFNKETEFDLENRSYNKIPIQGEYPIYYRYYEKPNTIINFLDYRAMAIDANNRNKTFMKILGGVGVFDSK